MKKLIWIVTGMVAGTLVLLAQQGQTAEAPASTDNAQESVSDTASQPVPPHMGLGRGVAPFAWGDEDKDGICDYTGRPVGQRMGVGRMGARGGRGAWGRGPVSRGWGGRGVGWQRPGVGYWRQPQQNAPAAPQPAPQATQQAK